MIKVIAIATKMFRVAGMLAYGSEDKNRTIHDISSLMQYARNIKNFEINGNIPEKFAANIEATKPPPQRIVKIGVQMILDIGATIGNWLKIAIDNGWEQMLAAKVSARALRTNSGHFGRGLAIQYSNKLENKIIPIVDPADSANETDTEVVTSSAIRIIMQMPSAFNGAGRRLLKNENKAM